MIMLSRITKIKLRTNGIWGHVRYMNTDLEGATTEMDRYHVELQAAQARIAYLAGQRPPQEAMP
jgi:hypothetical protein